MNEDLLVVIARLALVIIYGYIMFFFRKGYTKSKEAGFKNMFFLGYAFMFLFLFLYSIGAFANDLLDFLLESWSSTALETSFPKPSGLELNPIVEFIENLYRPLFVLGLIACELIFAAQVYPLEKMLKWEKTPGVKAMIVSAALMLLLFIPALQWTIVSSLIIYLSIAGIGYGFVMNIAVNIKLAHASTGAIRRRSIMIILASLLFYIGFIWSLEVGWAKFFGDLSIKWDIVFGSIAIAVSAFLFRTGFRSQL